MRKIKFGFSYSTKRFAIFSVAIRLWDRTKYSHCYIEFENRRFPHIPLIYQASHDMMNFMTKQVFLQNNHVTHEFELEISEEQHDRLLEHAMRMVGKPYSVRQIFGIVLADIFKLEKNPFTKDEESFICSEWCGIALEILGFQLKKDRNLLKPKDIFKALSNK
jgi:hypothetical protein